MRRHAPSARAARSLLPLIAATLAVAPAAAQASTKLDNVKAAAPAKVVCDAVAASAVPRARDLSQLILDGAPSALDRIRMQQQGINRPATVNTIPDRRALEPASRMPLSFTASAPVDCRNAPSPPGVTAEWDAGSELGTRAIPVKRTRFDDRWDRVHRAAPAALMQRQLQSANALSGLSETELLARVNQWVNREIAYVGDDRNYRRRDFWATADETLARGSGDCEDFAILKMQMLRAAGIDANRMKLVLLRDLAANADHAFLLVDTGGGKLVLDNVTDRLYDGARPQAVRPVLSFSADRRWVHAYRTAAETPAATIVPGARKSITLALADQRSVKAVPLTFKTGLSK
ncbi:transglutaminase-like cysteine peptidase [Sphingopyxis alaskensis]|jgi:predicted transglutaminase-like cysteine proteinase|uniref:Periplasmic protein-like protein n=1 Tax=Sphingopyxis alaskensis (strain DSM 13593 / LMG 18877 / RB2256) TaxID=317655 RepID=Q1GPF9_SPHAL|nr:transglutaminase-like cysteine peptidase [Sphingopyxis alaskensis]ABF54463.1 periplasmic protein-like protein [Sphingopyxis alaskensis RB2256]MCM3417826.1 transglutaminase-like cysteine peptidase [Sphingopyxis alaskensis]